MRRTSATRFETVSLDASSCVASNNFEIEGCTKSLSSAYPFPHRTTPSANHRIRLEERKIQRHRHQERHIPSQRQVYDLLRLSRGESLRYPVLGIRAHHLSKEIYAIQRCLRSASYSSCLVPDGPRNGRQGRRGMLEADPNDYMLKNRGGSSGQQSSVPAHSACSDA